MLFLALETSCDETSVAIIEANMQTNETNILSNIVSSQIALHAKWGGVVPDLAAREHLKNTLPVLKEALAAANCKLSDIDAFAVTQGPGLIPALLIGTNVAKTLSYMNKKPLLGIHHIEGHISAAFSSSKSKIKNQMPILCLIVSGGHTQLMLIKEEFNYEIIGQTQDDAVGEAFDKVAKILELGYPGGPIVSQKADLFKQQIEKITDEKLKGELLEIRFPRPMADKPNLDFSFSGLKTSVLYFVKQLAEKNLDEKILELYKSAICHAFQTAAIDVLGIKTIRAIKKFHPKTIILAGGVAANKELRTELEKRISNLDPEINFLIPPMELCGDNAAMIGVAAVKRYQKLEELGKLEELAENWKTLEADSSLKLKNLTSL